MDYARLRFKRRVIFSLLVLCLAVAVFIVRSSASTHHLHAVVTKARSVHRAPDAGPTPGDSHDPCDPSSAAYDQSACSPGTYRGSSASHSSSSTADAAPGSDNSNPTDSGDPCDPSSAAYDPSLCEYASSSVASGPDPAPSPDSAPTPDAVPTPDSSSSAGPDNGGSTGSGGACDPSSGDGSSCNGTSGSGGSNCDPNYEGACVPIRQGDVINCSDVNAKNFRSVGNDPYRLDADHDGIACEG